MFCHLEKEKCIACGLCQTIAPSFFDYNDNGIVLFASEDSSLNCKKIPLSKIDQIKKACIECPTHALLIQAHA